MTRKHTRFDLGEKISIVREAYELPKRIYATAEKYGVDQRKIKKWRKLLDLEDVRHGARMHRPVSSVRVEDQDICDHLRQYLDVLRARSIPVSVSMLVFEARRYVGNQTPPHDFTVAQVLTAEEQAAGQSHVEGAASPCDGFWRAVT